MTAKAVSCLLPTQSITTSYLDADLENGVLFASDNQNIFMVSNNGTEKWAIAISHPEFRAWRLEKGAMHWGGLFVPNVDLLIDPKSSYVEARREARAGDLTLAGKQMSIYCKPAGAIWAEAVQLTKSNSDLGSGVPSMWFSRWSLALREPNGDYQILVKHESDDT